MFKEILEELLKTMKESEQTEVFMREYIASEHLRLASLDDKPSLCGTPACIIGEQALKFNYEVFPTRDSRGVFDYFIDIQYTGSKACDSLLGGSSLWYSIVGATAATRRHYAQHSAEFTEDELELKHLHVDNPKLEDVILFL